jgi:hypothetical protein
LIPLHYVSSSTMGKQKGKSNVKRSRKSKPTHFVASTLPEQRRLGGAIVQTCTSSASECKARFFFKVLKEERLGVGNKGVFSASIQSVVAGQVLVSSPVRESDVVDEAAADELATTASHDDPTVMPHMTIAWGRTGRFVVCRGQGVAFLVNNLGRHQCFLRADEQRQTLDVVAKRAHTFEVGEALSAPYGSGGTNAMLSAVKKVEKARAGFRDLAANARTQAEKECASVWQCTVCTTCLPANAKKRKLTHRLVCRKLRKKVIQTLSAKLQAS